MTAVTAITAQNTKGVFQVSILPKEIEKQILYTSKDIRPDAIKIGMLHSYKTIVSVIKVKIQIKIILILLWSLKVVLNLLMKAIKILREKLIKKVHLITPNIPEAEILTKMKIKNLQDMIHSANILLKLGVNNVLIKGGHSNSKIVNDIFLNKDELKIFKSKRIKPKTHGTGCTLSSAIATFYGCGKTLNKSCEFLELNMLINLLDQVLITEKDKVQLII